MMSRTRIFQHALCLATVVPGLALAAPLPKEGTYDFTSCWSGEMKLVAISKTHLAFSYEMTGTNRSNPPGGVFDKRSFRCVGMNASFGDRKISSTVCEAVDAEGDKQLNYFWTGKDGKVVRETVIGTGKYEGMVTNGTVVPLGPFPSAKPGTFQNCNRQKGTYKINR